MLQKEKPRLRQLTLTPRGPWLCDNSGVVAFVHNKRVATIDDSGAEGSASGEDVEDTFTEFTSLFAPLVVVVLLLLLVLVLVLPLPLSVVPLLVTLLLLVLLCKVVPVLLLPPCVDDSGSAILLLLEPAEPERLAQSAN